MNTKQLRRLIERRQRVTMWAQKHWITPRLVSKVFGDGKQLIGLAPTMYRPNHFVVRIDSKWSLDWHTEHSPEEWLDGVYDAIEDEFYEWPWADEYWPESEPETYEGEAEERWVRSYEINARMRRVA